MQRLILIYPNMEHYQDVQECINEFYDNAEYIIHGSALLDNLKDYGLWLEHVNNINVDPFIKDENDSNVFLAYDKNLAKVIGFLSLRNTLDDDMSDYFGQMGYSIRPNYRQNSYGTELAQLGLNLMENRGHKQVMISCEANNVPSQKIIVNLGGQLHKQVVTLDNQKVSVYLIKF